MSDDRDDERTAYVDAAAQLLQMPLTSDQARGVAAVLTRMAAFAQDVRAFDLADDIEIAGVFTP